MGTAENESANIEGHSINFGRPLVATKRFISVDYSQLVGSVLRQAKGRGDAGSAASENHYLGGSLHHRSASMANIARVTSPTSLAMTRSILLRIKRRGVELRLALC